MATSASSFPDATNPATKTQGKILPTVPVLKYLKFSEITVLIELEILILSDINFFFERTAIRSSIHFESTFLPQRGDRGLKRKQSKKGKSKREKNKPLCNSFLKAKEKNIALVKGIILLNKFVLL